MSGKTKVVVSQQGNRNADLHLGTGVFVHRGFR